MLEAMNENEAKNTLLKKGKKLSQRSFVKSAESGSIKLVEIYLAAGFDINAQDQHGTTPLYAAVASEDTEMVRFLISNGASTDDPELFFVGVYGAAFSDDTEIIDALASSGAPLNGVDEETGFNVYELVCDMGNKNIATYLKEKYGF